MTENKRKVTTVENMWITRKEKKRRSMDLWMRRRYFCASNLKHQSKESFGELLKNWSKSMSSICPRLDVLFVES